jgi:probable HAF family extracellular repeat protein
LVAGTGTFPGQFGPHAFIFGPSGVSDFGTLGGSFSEFFAINGLGEAAGDSSTTDDAEIHAVISSGTGLMDLGTFGGTFSSATAISENGIVVGSANTTNDDTTEAFIFANGSMTNLGDLGGGYSKAVAVNNSGLVVGKSYTDTMDEHAFSWAGGALSDLGTLGGSYSAAFAVNAAGLIVGETDITNGDTHGFFYSGGAMHDLGTLGGTDSSALDINNTGQIIGTSTTAGDSKHAFIYSSSMTDLGHLGGDYTFPYAINSQGWVVGVSMTSNSTLHAFLWSQGSMVDLNSVLPTNSAWVLQTAQYLNDSGRIVGQGTFLGASVWYILDFVTSPGGGAPPTVVVSGPSQNVECPATVTLDGSQSSSSDGSPLSFQWTENGFVLGTNSTLTSSFPLGTNVVTLTVADACDTTASANVVVVVVDTTAPVITSSPASISVPTDSNCQGTVPNVLGQVAATDGCAASNTLVFSQNPAPGTTLTAGSYTLIVSVTDPSGNTGTTNIPMTVAGSGSASYVVTVSPSVLSPPNHKLVPVTVSVASSDACHQVAGAKILSITANESVSPGDIQITGCLTASLAASRNSSGPGRVYTITVLVADPTGQTSTQTVTVTVPKGSDTTPITTNQPRRDKEDCDAHHHKQPKHRTLVSAHNRR